MSSDPKDLPLTPDGLRARTAAYRESLSAPDTNDMFSLAYQWQDKNHMFSLAYEAEVAAYSKLVEKEAAFGIAQMKRAKAAEARAERLREALKVIAADPTNSAQAMVARKALEDDKQ